MDNYVAIVFDSDAKAYDGLHALWKLDADGDVTVHGAAVIHRDASGVIDVATKETEPGVRTAVGIGIGVLLGALAGPIGAAGGGAAGLTLPRGKSAVIAEVSEDWTTPIDTMAQRLGGTVYRRGKGDIRNDAWDWDYSDSLYPYDYQPTFA